MDAELRRRQRRAENANRPRPITQVVSIGPRANNGRYNLIAPDGGQSIGRAEKLFDAKHLEGDTAIALPRRDGVVLLTGQKAFVEADPKVNPLDLPALVDRCDGYIRGQIFNCQNEMRKFAQLWAIGTFGDTQTTYYNLINLLSGETKPITSVPNFVRPCPTGGIPPITVPDLPLGNADDPWYMHIWLRASFPTGPRCNSPFPPDHPANAGGNVNQSTIVVLANDGREWRRTFSLGVEFSSGSQQNWYSEAMSVFSQDPNPPGIPTGPHPVIRTGLLYQITGTFYGLVENDWVYSSAACPAASEPAPPQLPRDPNPANPDIPNSVEFSLSIGSDGIPIAYLRHTPSCKLIGRWDYDKSHRWVDDTIKTNNGKLKEDWRYGDTFDCRDAYRTNQFVNIANPKIWTIAQPPATIVPNTETDIEITAATIDPNNCGTPIGGKLITKVGQQSNNSTLTIVAIAALLQERRG